MQHQKIDFGDWIDLEMLTYAEGNLGVIISVWRDLSNGVSLGEFNRRRGQAQDFIIEKAKQYQLIINIGKRITMKRKHDHVGLVTNDLKKSTDFYVDILGFEVFGECTAPDGTPIVFLRNGDLKYEMFQPVGGATEEVTCRVDHMSFVSDDIEKDYEWFLSNGFTCTTNGIEALDDAWENGCRYFKIKGPGGEEVEFDQIL